MQKIEKILEIDKQTFAGVMMVFAASVGLATLGIFGKLSMEEGVTPLQFTLWRNLLCIPVFWLFALLSTRDDGIRKISSKVIVVSLIAGVMGPYLGPITGLTAISHIGVSLTTLIIAVSPALIMIFEAITRRKLPRYQKIATLIASLAGIYLIVSGGGSEDIFSRNIVGTSWALLAAVTFAAYVIIKQTILRSVNSIAFLSYCMVGGSIAALVHVLFLNDFEWGVTSQGLKYILISVVVYSASMLLLAKGVRRIGAARSSLIGNTSPAFAVFFAFIILGETLNSWQLIGGTVVLGSVILLERKALVLFRRKKKAETIKR